MNNYVDGRLVSPKRMPKPDLKDWLFSHMHLVKNIRSINSTRKPILDEWGKTVHIHESRQDLEITFVDNRVFVNIKIWDATEEDITDFLLKHFPI